MSPASGNAQSVLGIKRDMNHNPPGNFPLFGIDFPKPSRTGHRDVGPAAAAGHSQGVTTQFRRKV